MGPKGRHSYSMTTKLRVIEYTRLRRPDGGVVGNRGTTAALGQGLCPKRIREYVQTEVKIRQHNGSGGGFSYHLQGKKSYGTPSCSVPDVTAIQ